MTHSPTLGTRERFILTTCELLEAQGYHATGLKQIIDESGSPRGSLYYHFPGGKEELTAEALHYVGESIRQRIVKHLHTYDGAPTAAIAAFFGVVAHHMADSDFQRGGPITTVALESAASSHTLRTVCDEIYESWRAPFATHLQSLGLSEGRAASLSLLVLAALEGSILLGRTARDTGRVVQVADELTAAIRAALDG